MIKFLKKNFNEIYVALLLFGAFFVVMPPTILGIPFYFFSVPLRYLLLFIAIYIIWTGILKGIRFKRNFINVFLIFWLLYSIRVVFDLEIERVVNIVFDSNMAYYQAIVYCFFVSLSCFYLRDLDYSKILKYSYLLLFLGCTVSFYIIQNVSSDLVQRAEGRFEGAQGMSSIDYGHYGVSLTILSVIYLFQKTSLKYKILYLTGIAMGLVVMFLSGSRSPFLALVFCILIYFAINKGMLKGVVYLMILILPIFVYFDSIISSLDQFGSNFILRLLSFIEGDRSERDSLFLTGLNQFLDAPAFGSSFLLNSGVEQGSYPHNLLLESFMAVGVVGGGLFLYLLINGLLRVLRILKVDAVHVGLAILFLQQFVLSMASLSIYSHLRYWILLSLILSSNVIFKKLKFN